MTKNEALTMCLEYIETNAHERKYVRHAIKQALADIKQDLTPVQKPRLDQGADYERGFIDGMQKQMQSSVDKAVNAMSQPAPVQELGARVDEVIAKIKSGISEKPTALNSYGLKIWGTVRDDLLALATPPAAQPTTEEYSEVQPAPVQEPSTRACRSCGGSGERDTGISESPTAICKPCAGTGQITTPPAAQQCKWPTCQTEEYQQALAEQIKQELVTGTAQPEWVPVTQQLLNAQHPWLYEPMWIAMKDGSVMTDHYQWMQGRYPDRFVIGSNTHVWAFEATHVMPMNQPKHPIKENT